MCTPELFVYELNKFAYNKLRFSESGDFRTQKDVDKASAIADLLDVPVWTYTARRDLDFTNLPANFTVNGSGYDRQPVQRRFGSYRTAGSDLQIGLPHL